MKPSIFAEKIVYFLFAYLFIIFVIFWFNQDLDFLVSSKISNPDFYLKETYCPDGYKEAAYSGNSFCIREGKIMMIGESIVLDLIITFDIRYIDNKFEIHKIYEKSFVLTNIIVLFFVPLIIQILTWNFTSFRPDFLNVYFSTSITYFFVFHIVPNFKDFMRIYSHSVDIVNFIFNYVFFYYFCHIFFSIMFFHICHYLMFFRKPQTRTTTLRKIYAKK